MSYSTHSFTTKDGVDIHYYKWTPATDHIKGVVQLAHGIGEHAGRYNHFAEFLQEEGFVVYANDHRIHGKSVKSTHLLGVYDGDDYFRDAVKDMRKLSKIIKKEYPSRKIILFGHSMGSLLSRQYVTKYGKDLQALILSGTASFMKTLGSVGLFSTKVIRTFRGRKKSNKVLKNLFFSEFNKKFKPNRTQVDWISRDKHQVDLFEADPLRIENFSLSVIEDVIKGSKKINNYETFKNTPNDIPVYLFSGDCDPVGEMGKGVVKVAKKFKKAGNDVTLKLYKGGRHEMLNEINKEEVEQDLLNWLDTKIQEAS
ncbi:MAG: alpha/beta hydrolase [Flavobacteriaceae bacterium]|nr:alpha/beta hydrolase [Flavobacteriaceae bacterium]|tara:strand:+ start:82270 stop:83205 length:936 start_codon:yes stop_codon:yes gene_type:complete